jgi:hypothetical protein
MQVLAHTALTDGHFRESPALAIDWDRLGFLDQTTARITAVISLPGGARPTRHIVELEHVSRRRSAHSWRRPHEPQP